MDAAGNIIHHLQHGLTQSPAVHDTENLYSHPRPDLLSVTNAWGGDLASWNSQDSASSSLARNTLTIPHNGIPTGDTISSDQQTLFQDSLFMKSHTHQPHMVSANEHLEYPKDLFEVEPYQLDHLKASLIGQAEFPDRQSGTLPMGDRFGRSNVDLLQHEGERTQELTKEKHPEILETSTQGQERRIPVNTDSQMHDDQKSAPSVRCIKVSPDFIVIDI